MEFFKRDAAYLKVLKNACDKVEEQYLAVSDFIPEIKFNIAKALAKKNNYYVQKISYFSDPDKVKVLFCQNEIEVPLEENISIFRSVAKDLRHSDVLGYLLNNGVKFEKVGHISIDNEYAYVEIDPLLNGEIMNITRLRGTSVEFSLFNKSVQNTRKFAIINLRVSSVRLDKITSELCKESREKSKTRISKGEVFIDFTVNKDVKYNLSENTILSIKNQGRYIIESIEKQKNDSFSIRIKKYS